MTDPFRRLVETQTISSLARRIATKVPTISQPPDSLDLALASNYDHHAVWCAPKASVVKQDQMCLNNHAGEWSTRRSEEMDTQNKKDAELKFIESKFSYRGSDNTNIRQGIPPYHVSSSRRGYSRGPDGCFYSA